MLPLTTPIPWLAPAQAQLREAIAQDRLSHALLITASPGQGGEWLAYWLAASFHCEQTLEHRPCGSCRSCRRVIADEQPDCLVLRPIEESKEIRVDQVRDLTAELSLTAYGAGRKVAIVSPAEKLNRAAANALLKTLEEPTRGSVLILVSGEAKRLPPTVQSRCTRIRIAPPTETSLVQWLQSQCDDSIDWRRVLAVIGANPLAALEVDAAAIVALYDETVRSLERARSGTLDAIETAEIWGKDAYGLRIACMEHWLLQQLRQCVATDQKEVAARLFELQEPLREARQWIDSPINKSLALERLLWSFNSVGAGAPSRGRA
ncbi:MAG: DNA polymerase III subunit delta' [Gammaproteobacteria bacterium]|nr:DNA polymerase III subunit delta' [Gammaproteobacteria bacterium]